MKTIRPPSGLEDYLSRRSAAVLLGFASEFKVRQLEKAGRLVPVRGAMGSAWYPRAAVMALRDAHPAATGAGAPPAYGRWSDGALIGHLRGRTEAAPGESRLRTIVDLVADTGVSISRAERVYRFWLAHDLHPAADAARTSRGKKAPLALPKPIPAASATTGERRSRERTERDSLLLRMRDPDPKVRAAAFEALKKQRT